MIRLLLLSVAGAIVAVGFCVPFARPDIVGIIVAIALVLTGALLFWWIEAATKRSLDEDSGWNRFLKADGDTLLERKKPD